MQLIIISGNIVADAQVKKRKADGAEYVAFSVAVNETYGETRETTYYDVYYTKTAQLPFLKKGQAVDVVGTLKLNAATTADGKPKVRASIGNVYRIELRSKADI